MATDNTPRLMEHQDYGIKISKAGFDANTAADNDLLFNSSWPSVQILSVTNVTAGTASVSHDLNYPPLAMLFDTNMGNMRGASVDKNKAYTDSRIFSGGNAGILIVYTTDISVDIDYPYNTRPSVNVQYDTDYGIKVPKLGESIDSTDLRDFILHSRCGSPLVLAVKTEATVSPDNPLIVQYTAPIGYPVLTFGYVGLYAGQSINGMAVGEKAYFFAPQGGQSYPITFTTGTTSNVTMLSSGSFFSQKASIISLRSPMFATTNTVSVTY